MTSFARVLKENGFTLKRKAIQTLQVNIGKRCNQACSHCHVESSPYRTENMDKKTVDRLLFLLENEPMIQTVDITGGAPELNPYFRYFVRALRDLKKHIIDRCNLTILLEPGQVDTDQFLAENQVEIIASLPCYLKDNVEKQRGKGVFGKSITALKRLNALGYGQDKSGLSLNLVYNPTGPYLPPNQTKLEIEYKHYLYDKFGIRFNRLFTITNMPIKRYADFLKRRHYWESYTQLLRDHFNPDSVHHVMCGSLISVGWDGQLYDCDFNQMLEIPLSGRGQTLWDIQRFESGDNIAVGDHCFGCTAGSGSSCGGALVMSNEIP